MNEEQLKNFINSTGALAEMSVIFLNSCLNAGATYEMALDLVRVFFSELLFNKTNNKTEGE